MAIRYRSWFKLLIGCWYENFRYWIRKASFWISASREEVLKEEVEAMIGVVM